MNYLYNTIIYMYQYQTAFMNKHIVLTGGH